MGDRVIEPSLETGIGADERVRACAALVRAGRFDEAEIDLRVLAAIPAVAKTARALLAVCAQYRRLGIGGGSPATTVPSAGGQHGSAAPDRPAPAGRAPLDPDIRRKLDEATALWPGVRGGSGGLVFGFNAAGSRQPLFWCFQGAREMVRLAQQMGPDQPVFGMRSGFEVMPYSPANVGALASLYADDIMRIDPAGPYWLGGNCQGGVIAAVVALELIARGRKVSVLTVLDASLVTLFLTRPFPTPTLFIYGKSSRFNPGRQFRWPELGWRKFFPAGVKLSYLPADHGGYFSDGVIELLAEILAGAGRWSQENPRDGRPPERWERLGEDGYKVRFGEVSALEAVVGVPMRLKVKVQNRGSIAWSPTDESGVALGNHWLSPAGEMIVWADGRAKLEVAVAAGGVARILLTVSPPSVPGDYLLELDMVEEGVTWFKDKGSRTQMVPVRVRAPGGL